MEKRILQIVILACIILLIVNVARAQHWALPADVKVSVQADTFNAQELQQIEAAIDSWRPLLPNGLTLTFAEQGQVTIIRESVPGKERGETTAFAHNGLTDSVIIRIDPRAKGNFLNVVEHEIGHALGLMNHYPKSVMQEKTSKFQPAELDAEKLRAIYPTVVSSASPHAAPEAVLPVIPTPQIPTPKAPDVRVITEGDLKRYSFRRVVTIKDVGTRTSVFTFNDRGERIETEIVQTGKRKSEKFWRQIPIFPIGGHPSLSAPEGYYVLWTDAGLAGFRESSNAELLFPVKAVSRDGTISIQFYDYREFRVNVSIKEVS